MPILIIGPVLRAFAGCSEVMLNMSGKGSLSVRAHIISMVIGVVGVLVLVPAYGLAGAAIAATLATAANGVVLLATAKQVLGRVPSPFRKTPAA